MLSKYTNSNSEPAHPERIHKHVFFVVWCFGFVFVEDGSCRANHKCANAERKTKKNRKQKREKVEMCKCVHSEPLQMVVCVFVGECEVWGWGAKGGHDGRCHKIGGH